VQSLQSIRDGDLIELRRQRWRVLDLRPYEACQLATLAGVGSGNAGVRRRFLLPFDEAVPVERRPTPRVVRPQSWRRVCRSVLAEALTAGGLSAALSANLDVLPHQLEPALAVVRGLATRVLLADDVGLGKTVQAGLIVAELRARGLADRVLVVTPPGLRDQWRQELARRFGLEATVVDAAEVRRRVASLPVGLNPWLGAPIAIVSADYVKRPEVLEAASACCWEAVIIDEAHQAGPTTDRHHALARLAARAAYVLLVTATPHQGDARAFAALCGLGAQDDPVLVFRRTRADVHVGARRRIHRLTVAPGPAERRMYVRLAEFAAAARAEHDSPESWLALSVLYKRAFSSPRALELTIARRIASRAGAESGVDQLRLPMEGADELDPADEPPDCLAALALADARRDRALLAALLEAARDAVREEAKLRVLCRLLRRVREPVIVFTEYRDTLAHVRASLPEPAAVLHGGLSREERRMALEEFAAGSRRLLLATDAAGEGLNLQQRCRLVVNLELPWNPMRLEQRIGRVDRIGQRRPVHIAHLIGRGTGEARVLAHLKARMARAAADIAPSNPIDDERAIARALAGGRAPAARSDGAGREAPDRGAAPGRLIVDLRREAAAEARRLSLARALALAGAAGPPLLDGFAASAPWVTIAAGRRQRSRVGRRCLALVRIDHEDAAGRRRASTFVPLSFHAAASEAPRRARDLRAFARRAGSVLEAWATDFARPAFGAVAELALAPFLARAARDGRIAAAFRIDAGRLHQLPLFDRRPGRASDVRQRAERETIDDLQARAGLHQAAEITAHRPRLLLLLVPRLSAPATASEAAGGAETR